MAIISIDVPCIVVPMKTGVIYTNQVGGYAVIEMTLEGYIIPLKDKHYNKVKEGTKSNNDNPYWNIFHLQEEFDKLFAPLNGGTKYNGHGYSGIDEDDADYIEQVCGEDDSMRITVNRDLLDKCMEAKIYVQVELVQYDLNSNKTNPLVVDGILTWENSD